MMLKPVSSRILVGVASKIRKNEHGGVSGIFGLCLDVFPELRTKTVCAPDSFNVERVSAGVRDVDVMHGDPEQIGRFLFHQAFRNIDGKLIRAGDSSCMRLEIIDGELQD